MTPAFAAAGGGVVGFGDGAVQGQHDIALVDHADEGSVVIGLDDRNVGLVMGLEDLQGAVEGVVNEYYVLTCFIPSHHISSRDKLVVCL